MKQERYMADVYLNLCIFFAAGAPEIIYLGSAAWLAFTCVLVRILNHIQALLAVMKIEPVTIY